VLCVSHKPRDWRKYFMKMAACRSIPGFPQP
jgi:hypothetical protein